ncbi:RHS repeat-associated core domain-containing protein [Burkholderia sp. PAMC 26561]|uniref:RHS repeat-associated core domain-containing protein n=1 Tax=Burkholderia sp. PAMC 26561 TaxID=1795043 RepID=UPI000A3BBD7B|nr:RHS repeat-associated core domain-containing protein [Burkholderia sp. PAMC 26561]
MYFYRSRYYNPAQGRFISADPIGFASGQNSLYQYVDSDPINFEDPNGTARSPTSWCPECGAPNGNKNYPNPYCDSCYGKSNDPNGGVPYLPLIPEHESPEPPDGKMCPG